MDIPVLLEIASIVTLAFFILFPLFFLILLNPRSVHPHFQGLCVVFGLLSYIPSDRLTEHCCSHLLWLCGSAESDLITSVGWDFRPSLLHLYYTTLLVICQEVFEKFFKNFRKVFRLVSQGSRTPRTMWDPVPPRLALLTLILYHNEREKSIVKMHKNSAPELCKLPGPRPGRSPVRAMHVKEGLCDPLCKVVKHCAGFVL